MSELSLQDEHTVAVDTNAEYILPEEAKKQPPVLWSVSKAILVQTLKDFFGSIIGFFLRYIKHFLRCLVYFINPSLQKKPFNKLDFKENSQHAFEFVIIVLALLIFMVKLDWIPESSKDLLEIYNNDLMQKFMEVMMFLIFAVYYLLFAMISVLLGRLFKVIFKINLTNHESDILYVYLNNTFFSISAIVALIIRSSASLQTHDADSINEVLAMILLPTVFIPVIIWSVRFAALHKMKFFKGLLFFLLSTVLFSVFYLMSNFFICLTVLGI